MMAQLEMPPDEEIAAPPPPTGERALPYQAALYRISEAAHAASSLAELFPLIHGIVSELMPAQNFFLALSDAEGDLLRFPYFVDANDAAPAPRKRGRGLTEYVLRTGQALLAPAEVLNDLIARGEVDLIGAPAVDWLGVPLLAKDRTVGALVVQSYTPGVDFGEREKEILKFVSTQIAMAIERKRAEDALRRSEERYRLLFERNLAGVFSADAGGRLRDVNDAFVELFGFANRGELPGSLWELLESADDAVPARDLLRQKGRLPNVEVRVTRKDGETRWLLASVSILAGGPHGEPTIEGTVLDMTERKSAEERLIHLALHDVLTGLPNRSLFDDRFRLALVQAERLERPLALLFLDLDRFKPVNDELGHAAGDFLLSRAADRLRLGLRSGDTVARFGGDEFVVLLPNVGRGDAVAVAEKLRAAVGAPLSFEGHEISVTASIGIAIFPEDGCRSDELLRKADAALYRAKELGRNRLAFSDPSARGAPG